MDCSRTFLWIFEVKELQTVAEQVAYLDGMALAIVQMKEATNVVIFRQYLNSIVTTQSFQLE